ncbi:unnamed protein product [Rhizoctonia solani]|uniref:BTB domain-containing protein n=1 Tax=Rhizoctonia solani TaxID=456999 RepID=A0A8H3DCV2_9AGAM|nr:unnamed protein product [Rhizoctonia solani]
MLENDPQPKPQVSQEASSYSTPMNHTHSLVPELNGEPLFESGGGDMELIVNGTRFETHRYLIKRFKKWRETRLPLGETMVVEGTASSEDFSRMFKVLYATMLEGPFEFDTSTLVSALHIATEYEYPALRDYAVRHLEQADLTAIKRIELARKFGLTSWEKPAYTELCSRDGAITEEEAGILGMAAFVRVARIREKEQRRRTRADVEQELKTVGVENPRAESMKKDTTDRQLPLSGEEPKKENLPQFGRWRGKKDPKRGTPDLFGGLATKPGASQDRPKPSETQIQPSFMNVPTTGTYQSGTYDSVNEQFGLPTPECNCEYHGGYYSSERRSCILPPCAVAAFKNLQIEQLAHTKSIADLRSSVDELQATSKPELAPNQEIDSRSLTHSSIQEEVQAMLNELS